MAKERVFHEPTALERIQNKLEVLGRLAVSSDASWNVRNEAWKAIDDYLDAQQAILRTEAWRLLPPNPNEQAVNPPKAA